MRGVAGVVSQCRPGGSRGCPLRSFWRRAGRRGRLRRRGRPIRSTARHRARLRRRRPRPTASGSASTSTSTTTARGAGSGPMVTATLPVVVCQTTSGVSTTTTSLPASVAVSVPASDAQQGNLAVYSDLTGALDARGPDGRLDVHGHLRSRRQRDDGAGAGRDVGAGRPGRCGTCRRRRRHRRSSPWRAGAAPCRARRWPARSSARPRRRRSRTSARAAPTPSPPQEQRGADVVGPGRVPGPGRAWPGVGFPSGGQNAANGVMLYQPKPTEPTAYRGHVHPAGGAAGPVHGGAEPLRRRRSGDSCGDQPRLWVNASMLFPSGSRTKAP